MTRLLAVLVATVLVVAVAAVLGSSPGTVPPVRVPVAVRVVEPSPASMGAPPRVHDRRSHPHRCTDRNWRTFLHPAERFIDWQESRLDPTAVEPSTGAFGIGQLKPQTYRILGLPMSTAPCDQIAADLAYMRRHYGNWHLAAAHERRWNWW